MKKSAIVVFFSVFFSVYGLINWYIVHWVWSALPPGATALKAVCTVALLVLVLSFVAGRFLERSLPGALAEALVWIGSFWLGAILYLLLGGVLLDILHWVSGSSPAFSRETWVVPLFLLVFLLLVAGHVNTLFPRVRRLDLPMVKRADGRTSMTLAVASDIHLGTIIGRRQFDRIIGKINALNADLVLLPGDIVDEDLRPVIRENLGERLKAIRSRHGVLAVTGNHEYIGGVEPACAYLAEHGVRMLRDESVIVDHAVAVVGREDRSMGQFRGKRRKTLEELIAPIDAALPVILMDHQPFGLDEAVRCGVDLQLSGHTHHGQLWPLNYITRAVYEVSRGYLKKENTHIYVSNGVGTWGPPVRIGNRPEILMIVLNFPL